MNIVVLDELFDTIDIVDDFEYVIWDLAYYDKGFFEMKVPLTRLDTIKRGQYIYRTDSVYTGRIDRISVDDRMLIVSGNFLEAMLDFRVDIVGRYLNTNAESAMFGLLVDNLAGARGIPNLHLGANRGRGNVGTYNAHGQGLGGYFYELCEWNGLSYNIRLDIVTKCMEFNVIEGKNRTQTQSINEHCIFSGEFGNIHSEYYETNTDYPNFAHVLGETRTDEHGNDLPRQRVEVDRRQGREKRELFVSAGNIRQEDGMSDNQYRAALTQRGIESLIENGKFETIDFVLDESNNMFFELGDIVTYKHLSLGKVFELRVVEIKQVIEKNNLKKSVVLGR